MGLLMFSIAIVAMNYPVILTIIAPSRRDLLPLGYQPIRDKDE